MAARTSIICVFGCLLVASAAAAAAFDVVNIINSESTDYTTFAKLLADTKLADEINSRQTITVLAVNNGAVGAITSLPSDLQKEVLSVHVILDYYDPVKLDAVKQKTMLLTTLFQASGQATGQMGFLNYTELPDESQVFGSAVQGAPLDSKLVGIVAARPYNISVIGVSKAIIPPGLDGASKAAPPPTLSTKSPATPPSNASTPAKPSPAPVNATKPSSGNATAPSSSNAPTPSPKSALTPSGSTTPSAPEQSATPPTGQTTSPAPTDSKATPPTKASSPSTGDATAPTSDDQATPTEAPSSSSGATQAPAAAEGPAEAEGQASGSNASSPVPTDVSGSPVAGGPNAGAPVSADSDKTSSAGTVAVCTGFGLVAMGLVFLSAL